jgi:hypothetical protein
MTGRVSGYAKKTVNGKVLTHQTLHVVGAAVLEEEVDQHDTDEHDNRLKVAEVQSKVAVKGPGNEDEQRDHAGGNLQRRANGDTDGELHLAFAGHPDRGDVLGGVALGS